MNMIFLIVFFLVGTCYVTYFFYLNYNKFEREEINIYQLWKVSFGTLYMLNKY